MPAEISLWAPPDRDEVVAMILSIQRDEFALAITADDQPDLFDVDLHYRANGGEFWVADADGEVVGTIAAMGVDENTVAIRKMFVRADHRGRGTAVAASLMESLVGWAKRSGYRTLLLGTTDRMGAAHRFYEKQGFSPITADSLPASFPRMAVDSMFFRRDLAGVVSIRDYNPLWPELFAVERDRICAALGAAIVTIEHSGSTSVPGLAAKPIIDITMTVPDTRDESAYVPRLEAAGYSFRLREPDWYEHRLLTRDWPRVNLHVFPAECAEVDRMIIFRDWLRANAADRDLYVRVKRDLAGRDWADVQDYADAKSAVVQQIMDRARAERGATGT